jgi:hypothetical protein
MGRLLVHIRALGREKVHRHLCPFQGALVNFPTTVAYGRQTDTFFQTLRKEPWGAKTFIVKDPDGNLLLFSGPAD